MLHRRGYWDIQNDVPNDFPALDDLMRLRDLPERQSSAYSMSELSAS